MHILSLKRLGSRRASELGVQDFGAWVPIGAHGNPNAHNIGGRAPNPCAIGAPCGSQSRRILNPVFGKFAQLDPQGLHVGARAPNS
jgi:hypothetical protein